MKRSRNKGVYRYGQWIYEVRVRLRWKRDVIRQRDWDRAKVIQQHTWVSMGGPMVKVE